MPARSSKLFLGFLLVLAFTCGFFQARTLLTVYGKSYYECGRSVPAGVLAGMCVDLNKGIFYRPIHSAEGIGGTRYMPLYFVLLSALTRLGLSVMQASWALEIVAAIAMLGAVYWLLRELEVSRPMAATAVALTSISLYAQLVFSTLRLDMLAQVFVLLGLITTVRDLKQKNPPAVAMLTITLCYVLAFMTKINLVAAAVASVWVFYQSGNKRGALCLALTGVGLSAFFVALTQIASDGWFFTSFRVTGLANATLRDVFEIPTSLFLLFQMDPASFCVVLIAWVSLTAGAYSLRRDLMSVTLILTSLILFLTLASPGTSYNHLLDVYVLSVICVVRYFYQQQPRLNASRMATLGLIACFSAIGTIQDARTRFRYFGPVGQLPELRQVIRQLPPPNRPMLTDNPWLPVTYGERPYVIDPFMADVVHKRNPGALRRFQDQIEQNYYGCVVIENPHINLNTPSLSEWCMGYNFAPHLLKYYKIIGMARQGTVLVPRRRTASDKSADQR